MARKKSIGEVELEILQIVWDKKEASVNDVLKEVQKKRDVAYTTIMTILQQLAKKDFLNFRQEGRSYIYFAKVKKEELQKSFLNRMVDSMFKGSPLALVQFLVKNERMSNEEKAEIKKLLDEME